jgi:hypothetical protein
MARTDAAIDEDRRASPSFLPQHQGRAMDTIYNGIPATELGDVDWRKSQYSNGTGECVEMAALPNGEFAVRNSRFPDGPALVYTRGEITAFLAGAKDGEFDQVIV